MSRVDVGKALAHVIPDQQVAYNRREVILYAIGVGEHLPRFTYENHDDFGPLPTFGVVLSQKGASFDIVPFGSNFSEIPGLPIDPTKILHGEQYLEILKPLPVEGSFINKSRITGIFDKGKGAVMVTETLTVDNSGTPYLKLISSAFIRGLTGFTSSKGSSLPSHQIPSRAPDAVVSEQTNEHQALLYRLSGDYNPLHADANMAALVGFQKPILHGLLSFGYASRAVLHTFLGSDPARFKSISVRFTNPAYPGETLVTEMWKQDNNPNNILLQVKVKERNVVIISNALVETLPAPNSVPTPVPSGPALKSAVIFDAIEAALNKQPELGKQVNAVFQFNITHNDTTTTYTIDLKNGKLVRGVAAGIKPDTTITISDSDYVDLATGKLNPQPPP